MSGRRWSAAAACAEGPGACGAVEKRRPPSQNAAGAGEAGEASAGTGGGRSGMDDERLSEAMSRVVMRRGGGAEERHPEWNGSALGRATAWADEPGDNSVASRAIFRRSWPRTESCDGNDSDPSRPVSVFGPAWPAPCPIGGEGENGDKPMLPRMTASRLTIEDIPSRVEIKDRRGSRVESTRTWRR